MILKELLFSLFWLMLTFRLLQLLKFFSLENLPKSWIYMAFGIKILSSLLLLAIYTFVYTETDQNDVYRLFHDSKVLYDLMFEQPLAFFEIMFGVNVWSEKYAIILDTMNNWYSQGGFFTGNNRFIIRLHVIYSLLSGGSFFARFIIHNFIVFSGLILLYRFLSAEAVVRHKLIYSAVFLFPSVVFWTSGVFKEGIVLCGLGLLLWGSRKYFREGTLAKSFVLMAVGSVLLLLSRPYLFLPLVILLPVYYIKFNTFRAIFLKYLFTGTAAILILIIIDFSGLGFKPYQQLVEKQNTFITHAQEEGAGSLVYLPPLTSSPFSIVKTSAVGLYNSFLRPLFFDARNLTGLAASIENLFVLMLIIASVFYYNSDNRQYNFMLFCIFIVIINHLIIGITVPVAGAIVRYKVTTLPFLLSVLCLTLSSRTPFLRIFRS